MVEVVAWRTLGLDLTKCQTNGCEVGSPRSNQLGTLRRDGKQFVDKRRRKKREKERKKRKKGRKENKKKKKKGEREEEASSSIVSDLGGSRTDPTHFKR